MDKTIFLDRDGVLNEDVIGGYITKPEMLKLLPGVIDGMKRLIGSGLRLIMISNQAGIGDGVYSRENLDRVHEKLVRLLGEQGIRFDGVYYCLHGKHAGCDCRKPRAGLFRQAAGDFKIDKAGSYFVGDKISDVDAGHEFGIKVIMVRTGHGKNEEKKITTGGPEYIVDGFREAVDIILRETNAAR